MIRGIGDSINPYTDDHHNNDLLGLLEMSPRYHIYNFLDLENFINKFLCFFLFLWSKLWQLLFYFDRFVLILKFPSTRTQLKSRKNCQLNISWKQKPLRIIFHQFLDLVTVAWVFIYFQWRSVWMSKNMTCHLCTRKTMQLHHASLIF